MGVHMGPHLAQKLMSFRKIFAVGVVSFEEIGNRVEAYTVDSHREPVIQDFEHFPLHVGVVKVEIRLVRIEAVPVVRLRLRVPRPVGGLEILKNNARLGVLFRRVTPYVEVAPFTARFGGTRPFEPGVLVGCVVNNQLGDNFEIPGVRFLQKTLKIPDRPVGGMHTGVVRDIIAVVPPWRRVKRQHPDRVNAQIMQIIQLTREAAEVTHAVAVAVHVGSHVQLVDNRIFVPVVFSVCMFVHCVLQYSGARSHPRCLSQRSST